MNRSPRAAILVLFMMLSSGCLGAVDDLEDIEDEVIDPILDWLEGEYPRLDLPDRERTSPTLDIYNECENLLADLQDSIYNEMLVSLDQQAYWHWAAPVWRGGGVWIEGDVAMMDGAPEMAADDSSGSSDSDGGGSREGEYSGTNNQEEGVDEADLEEEGKREDEKKGERKKANGKKMKGRGKNCE